MRNFQILNKTGLSVFFLWMILIPLSGNLFAQDVFLEVHAKPFNIDRGNLDTKVNYSNAVTNKLSEADVLDLGLTLGIGNQKKLIYVLDINWAHQSFRKDFTWPRTSASSNDDQSTLISLGSEQLQVGIGVDKPIVLHDRLITYFGGRVIYGRQFNYKFTRSDVIKDTLGVLLSTRDEARVFPDENTIGMDIVGRVYFKVIPRLSVGISLINRFGFLFTNSPYVHERRSLDADGIETGYFRQEVTGNVFRFAYNFSVSFGIQYQIAKRKEKKKKADRNQ